MKKINRKKAFLAIDANDVVDRMQKAVEVRNDKDLSDVLNISKSTVSSWRKRNSIPYAECVWISVEFYTSLDWIIRGIGPMVSQSDADLGDIDCELLAVFMMRLDELSRNENIENPWERALYKTRSLMSAYAKYEKMLSEEVIHHGISRDVFINHLKEAISIVPSSLEEYHTK